MGQIRVGNEILDKIYIANASDVGGSNADPRGFSYTLAPSTSFRSKRIATSTAGIFGNVGDVNVAPNKTMGAKGDIITKLRAEVKTVTNGAKAAIWVTQLSDPIFAMNQGVNVGPAVTTANNTLTLTSNAILPAAANTLADRFVAYLHKPDASPIAYWCLNRIVSHAAISTTTITLTVEDPVEVGSIITEWWIHGERARRLMEPNRAPRDQVYVEDVNLEAETGGFKLWHGSAFASLELTGVFTG